MTEKVTCPYCGAGMQIMSWQFASGLNGDIRQYKGRLKCPRCMALSPEACGKTPERAEEKAIKAALRRAEPENRVLTLEEVEQICEKGQVTHLWIEHKNTVFHFSCWRETDFIRDKRLRMQDFVDGYSKEIRCWLRKPTDEERKAVKWDD